MTARFNQRLTPLLCPTESRLGALLKSARESKAWSLQEAADVIGTAKSHLHAIESGKNDNPTLRMIAAFVIAYGIRPEAIIACATQQSRAVIDAAIHPLNQPAEKP